MHFHKNLSYICVNKPINNLLKLKTELRYMETYNLKNLSDGLQEAKAQGIKGNDIAQIAAAEKINTSTVYEYLKGNVTIPALGKSILARCRKMLIEKANAA